MNMIMKKLSTRVFAFAVTAAFGMAPHTAAAQNGYDRTVLVEEFTTEMCSNCPAATEKLHRVLANPAYAGRVVAVCHHTGFMEDWLTLPDDNDYLWLYNTTGGTYAPAMMIDRVPTFEETSAVFGLSLRTEEELTAEIDKRLATPSPIKVNVTASVGDDNRLTVDVSGERTAETQKNAKITVYVVENNVEGDFQSGYGKGYIHQHVTRAINKTWGESIKWSGTKYAYQCTFELDDAWKRADMEVVAVINRDVPSNVLQCEVINSATVPLVQSGISDVKTEKASVTACYDMQGRRLDKCPARGCYIMVYTDGTAKKVLR